MSVHFSGRRVAILPDNDAPGRAHAEKVAGALAPIAAIVKVVELPNLPEKGDVSDWLDAGGTVEHLWRLCNAAAPGRTIETKGDAPTTNSKARTRSPTTYEVRGGELCYVSSSHDGGERVRPLANFRAWIKEEIVVDDSAGQATRFVVAGELIDGTPLPDATMDASQFASMNWVVENWGARPRPARTLLKLGKMG